MNDDILKSLGIVSGAVIATVAPYVATWIQKKRSKNQEASIFIHNTEYRSYINDILIEIRASVGANRVALVEYHNGSVAINGLPFNYASMTYEKTDNTTKDMMLAYQKVPISPISELLLEIHHSKEGYVRVGQDYKQEGIIKLNRYYGAETTYMFRIGDHVKHGTISLTWVSEDKTLTEDEIEDLQLKVMYVGELTDKMKKH